MFRLAGIEEDQAFLLLVQWMSELLLMRTRMVTFSREEFVNNAMNSKFVASLLKQKSTNDKTNYVDV